MLEKVKGFYEKHETAVWFVVGAATGYGLYRLGYSTAVRRSDTGLNMCFLVKPELKPMLEEAVKTVEGSVGKVK